MAEDDPILISDVVHWGAEFRCFVLERRVVAHSIYLRDGDLDNEASPEELRAAHAFASAVVATLDCPPAFVLDVGVLDDGRWAVVEANPAWGAGVYACDADAVLDVLHAAVRGRASVDEHLQRWVIPRPQVLD